MGMTREEAYNRIDAIIARHEIDDDYVTITSVLDYDALRIARKTLEQEPCEDAISREEANQFLYERVDRLDDNELYDIFSRIIDDMYNELPSVKPQEQKIDVLDKIRVEIESLQNANPSYWHSGDMVEREEVLEIIDKYKEENHV